MRIMDDIAWKCHERCAMNQDASSLHKEMLENVLDMEAENDALKKVA